MSHFYRVHTLYVNTKAQKRRVHCVIPPQHHGRSEPQQHGPNDKIIIYLSPAHVTGRPRRYNKTNTAEY